MHEPGKWDQSQFGDAELDGLLAELKAPEEVTPAPGFYARVMDRIESQRSNSIWSAFLEPIFGRRLALASGVLMLLLGAALFVPGSEVDDELSAQGRVSVTVNENEPAPVLAYDTAAMDGRDQDKNAVLVNLVTYQEH